MAEPRPGGQPHRFLRLVVPLVALAIAACARVVPEAAPPPPPPRPEVTRPVTPVGPLPTDEARHRVALLVPTTGANAAVGQSIANAANLALLDTGGARIRMTVYDTGSGAAAAANRALAEGNRLILGPLLAEDVRAVAPVAAAQQVPVVAFSNDTSAAAEGVYLLGFAPEESVRRVVDYAGERGLKRFAGLIPSGVYGRRVSNVMLRSVEASGGTVVAMETYDRSAPSLAAAVKKLGGMGAYDAVLIADSGRIVLQAVPQIRRAAGAAPRILGTELWNTDTALSTAPAVHGAWFAAVSDRLYGQFATKYRARFGRGPYRLASLGYDSVLLATRVAANWQVGRPFPVAMLRDRDGFSGVDGAFRFGRDGVVERALEVKQVGPGANSVVSPAPRGF